MSQKNQENKKKYFERYLAERQEEFEQNYNHEKAWRKLEKRIKRRQTMRIGLYSISTAAAVIVFTIGLNAVFLSKPTKKISRMVSAVKTERPLQQEVTLTLGNGQQVNLSATNGNIENGEKITISNKANQSLTYKNTKQEEGVPPQNNTLHVPRGSEYLLELSDGTKIWMNSDSKLCYPSYFAKDIREVYLEGEAFFDVAEDNKRKFIVHAGVHHVEVLGTSFNVSAYPGQAEHTTLSEGKLKVVTSKSSVILHPNQQATITKETQSITKREVEASRFSSWIKGIYEFKNTSLEEITAQMSRWYDVEFIFNKESLRKKRFTGVIFKQEDLDLSIEVFRKVSNIRFIRSGNTIYIG